MIERYSDHWLSQPLWHAELNNGDIVTQYEPEVTWSVLRDIIEKGQEKVSVVALWLSFRDNIAKPLKRDALGYFFGKSTVGMMPGNFSANFYLIGELNEDDTIDVQFWEVPELKYLGTEVRLASDKEKVSNFLLRNPIDEKSNRLGENQG